jgi:ABC-type glycerol-3-phosphate transport system substrate-binding protein
LRRADATSLLLTLLLCATALLWATPFAWIVVASLRPGGAGQADIASLWPSGPFSLGNFVEALDVRPFSPLVSEHRAALQRHPGGAVRQNMKAPYRVAFLPRQFVNAAPIGGASLIIPRGNSPERQAAAWTLIDWLTSPEIAGGWSRFTGYFAPRIAAYDLPAMKTYIADHPDAKVALDQLAYARGWFATYNVVGVRKALEDGVQAVLSGKAAPEAAMARAQAEAEALMKPYVEQTALKLPQ